MEQGNTIFFDSQRLGLHTNLITCLENYFALTVVKCMPVSHARVPPWQGTVATGPALAPQ